VKLSLGERKDIVLSGSFNSDRNAYIQMIDQKTAALIQASAEAAALLAGKDRNIYRTYGRNLGLAFQMIDDILDITQDSDVLGKPSMHDYVEGKTTLPYIYLYEALNDAGRKKLVSMHGRDLAPDEERWIVSEMEAHGAISRARNEAKDLVSKAIDLMESVDEPSLGQIARSMIERDF
jgi:octaprenyl-diphosphate synthase